MSEQTPTMNRGDEYIVFFRGGPNEGQTDRRISTDGTWDDALTVIATVDGKETLINYRARTWREMGDQYQVEYVFDPETSEELEPLEDRGEH